MGSSPASTPRAAGRPIPSRRSSKCSDGTMWFGTPNGLSAFSRGRWRTYTTRDGLPSNDITTVFEDRHGVLWVGTALGLAFVRRRPVARVSTGLRPCGRSVLGVAEDQSRIAVDEHHRSRAARRSRAVASGRAADRRSANTAWPTVCSRSSREAPSDAGRGLRAAASG